MQRGAGFAIGRNGRDLCTVTSREPTARVAGGLTMFIGHVGRTLDHDAAAIHDVTCRDDRCAALYETTDRATVLFEATAAAVEVSLIHPVPAAARRVVVTADRWYVASESEVHVLARRTAPELELIALDAVDVAASSSLVCVVDSRGLTWFDRDGRVEHRRTLGSPTAVAVDELAGGWLVVADGDVVQLASPAAAPVVLARNAGLATRIRRDADALYMSTPSGELLEALGVRHGPAPAGTRPRAVAAYAPGFTEFDARFELYVDEGNGPRPFYADVPCRCRTRSYEVLDEWSTRQPDNSRDYFERQRCPLCGHEWERNYAG